jgi:LmbE family N-acetylglucosaminyl deacetylase
MWNTSRRQLTVSCSILLLILWSSATPTSAQEIRTSGDIQLALQRLNTLGSLLYIAAHPDDENTAFLTYLTKGRGIRAAYLSLTRGEGGQNLVGSEQGDLLGIIRTQELLAARRIDGAEQFFTRAIDFGYSKNPEEALRIWGKEDVVGDVVWIIRTFRPDVIVTRFSPTIGGHGHHTASAIIAREVFKASDDPTAYPEQLDFTTVWKPKRLLYNFSTFFSTPIDTTHALRVDLGEYNPLLGRSYTEIAGESRSMHKSQGFGAVQRRGPNVNFFQHTAGDTADSDFFDGIDLSWSRIPGGGKVGALLDEALRKFRPETPSSIVPLLLDAWKEMERLPADPLVISKRKELKDVLRACMGLWVEGIARERVAVPGDTVHIVASAINRSTVPITLERVRPSFSHRDSSISKSLTYNQPLAITLPVLIPRSATISQPYWLIGEATQGRYSVSDVRLTGKPENDPPITIRFELTVAEMPISFDVPVSYRWVDPVQGEMMRRVEIVPPVSVNCTQPVTVYKSNDAKHVTVTLRSNTDSVRGEVRLAVPQGWGVQPEAQPFVIPARSDERTITFMVHPMPGASTGMFLAEARISNNAIFSRGMRTLEYPHIAMQTMFPNAEGKLVRVDCTTSPRTIGYIMGAGDEIPAALREVGYNVTLLSDEELTLGNLQRYNVIVAGVRAYNTRLKLRASQRRLMAYVQNGGTYIVQYVTMQQGESDNIGPYPFSVSRERVSVEDAPVSFNDAMHPILRVPNRITQRDFDGWVQERGLYFADKWDSTYFTLLVSNDPGEPPKAGGLLTAKYGKGYYVYTGYSFFRQLPAGVPGAYRLFVNMIELGTKR